MAKKEDNVEHEPLTEEQRITALEEKVGTNKLVLISIALFLIITVSVSATVFIISMFGEDEDATANSQMIAALEAKIVDLEKTLENIKKLTRDNKGELSALSDKVANSSNQKLQQLMIDQERGQQMFLDALRTGMYDLAHMIPGSRTWLEVYGEKVDSAERYSKDREKELTNLQKGIVNNKPKTAIQEDPFEDGF
jgi:hypothetical protein